MTPTNKLRFVEREIRMPLFGYDPETTYEAKKIRVLQQWWVDNRYDIHWMNGAPGEWRDVPLEVEV